MKIDDIKMGTNSEYTGKLVTQEEATTSNTVSTGADTTTEINTKELPTKFGMWSRVKSFLFQEIGFKKDVSVELSPKEEKVLTEVHDFLFQEISFSGLFSLGKSKKKNNDETKQQL